MRFRHALIGAGALGILGLVVLACVAPPDGQERGDLAQFIGGLHPLAVHLPIAFILLVPFLEVVSRRRGREALRSAAGFVLGLAALSALATPYLGWLLAWSGGFEGALLTQHMWGGIGVASASLLCWSIRSRFPTAYFAALTLAVVLVAFTGYRGGQLAHGEQHLTEHLMPMIGMQGSARPDENSFYAVRIAPVFKKHCVLCHGSGKSKGGLRLDSYASVMRGGKDGKIVAAGDAGGSELIRRISLDSAAKDFMPAEGKPPLVESDRDLLRIWIDSGASGTAGLDSIAAAPAAQADEPWAPDYTTQLAALRKVEEAAGLRLVPRSQNPTDGLILRTFSDPEACDDAALAALKDLAPYIVDAELARSRITDAGLQSLAGFVNLRSVDLTGTRVTAQGVAALMLLPRLASLNLTETGITRNAMKKLPDPPTALQLYVDD
jgi:uncharacterized membrane protein/mono/diheme cytochrome c family protein